MIITVFVAFVCIYTAAKIWISEERTTVFNKKKIEVKDEKYSVMYLSLEDKDNAYYYGISNHEYEKEVKYYKIDVEFSLSVLNKNILYKERF